MSKPFVASVADFQVPASQGRQMESSKKWTQDDLGGFLLRYAGYESVQLAMLQEIL
jgi:hypothetical protein